MIKIVTIIGARPQIIKSAAISRAIRTSFSNKITEIIVHTGQHYDVEMSDVFFTEMQIPQPNYNLNVGSLSHANQTATMLAGIEDVLLKEKPHALLVYGDTNSTLAGAIAASKIHIPVLHVEAGLRSFNKAMPEEINRIVTDHTSTMLFCPTQTGVTNLINEGFADNYNTNKKATIDNPFVIYCGDIMYDNTSYFSEIAEKHTNLFAENNVDENNYILATIHRPSNTDSKEHLTSIFKALLQITDTHKTQIVLPIHPRTAALLQQNLDANLFNSITASNKIIIIKPLSFLQMLLFEKKAKLIITDSGGVQKEAYFLNKAAVILRTETEWVEIVNQGAAQIVGANYDKIISAANYFLAKKNVEFPLLFGDGKSAEKICKAIVEYL